MGHVGLWWTHVETVFQQIRRQVSKTTGGHGARGMLPLTDSCVSYAFQGETGVFLRSWRQRLHVGIEFWLGTMI